jgi:acyl-CoA thioesterase YciA
MTTGSARDRDGQPAIRVLMMPRDTNGRGTIFGGVLLSHIDQAGAIEAQKVTHHKIVTVAMEKVEFLKPVFVGDVVSFFTHVERIGRTSITVKVSVISTRLCGRETLDVDVTQATIVFVAVDDEGRPIPLETK